MAGKTLFISDGTGGDNSDRWKFTTGIDDIATDSLVQGDLNQAQVSPISSFTAFESCEDLIANGKVDWYLPAKDELNIMSINYSDINAAATNALSLGDYWSSSEFDIDDGWRQILSSGVQTTGKKDGNERVRCVRYE
ncbi:MAG: DUF1566 domain-containing protein [Gammaproteobacteria bacterium]|nr:DUF1566 domain-containing protein [Gammaproteobacteria bacterium]